MDGLKNKLNGIVAKVKSIKHIEVIIAIVAVAIMILIFTGTKSSGNKTVATKTPADTKVESDLISEWERKLSTILSGIDGVGKAEVMITAKSTSEKITANTTSSSTTLSGNGANSTTNVTTSPIIVANGGTSEPYVTKEIMPEVMGVIVVAEGADNAVTKLSIMRAVQTALDVDSSCVEIYPMK